MTRRLIVRPEAERDLTESANWYETQNQGLGDEFLDEVQDRLKDVVDRPNSFAVVSGRTRRALLDRFPYAIFFIVERDAVAVTAVLHTARDPDVWRRRS